MRRILYVLASPGWGGGEQYVYDLMKALQGEYDCYAVTPRSEAGMEKLRQAVPEDHIFSLRMGSLFDLGSAFRMARIVRNKEIDIIHVNKFSDAFLAVWARKISRRRVRIVMTRHLIRRGKTGWLYRYLYRQLDELVFVSELARREFMSRGPKIDSTKMHVIRNGIADTPQDTALRSGSPVVIAFAGRIVPEKGLDVLIGALSKIPEHDFRLKLIGNGPAGYMSELERMAEAGGIAHKISFAGFADDVNAQLQEASIGVLPSIVREGFPISVLEYMRAGLAVVASENGGQAECLADGSNAFLVPPGDRDKLAEAIGTLLKEPQELSRMGANARRAFLENLTYDRFLGRIRKLYEKP